MIKIILFAFLCIRISGNTINYHFQGKWIVYNQFRSESSQLSEDVSSTIRRIRGGSDENKESDDQDDKDESVDSSKIQDGVNDHQIDDVEIIPFDDDQFLDSSDTEDVQDNKDTKSNTLHTEQPIPKLKSLAVESESSHDGEFYPDTDEHNLVDDVPFEDDRQIDSDDSDEQINHASTDENVSDEENENMQPKPNEIDTVDTTIDADIQSVHDISDSCVEERSDTETIPIGVDVESRSIIWKAVKPDAYNLKYKITKKLQQWADEDRSLNDDDQSKELRLLLHNKAQSYVRDLIAFEEDIEAENSSKNIPHPKKVLHFIGPKIKAIKQSPYISLQIRGASQDDARVAASTLAVMAGLTELYCIVKKNCERNIGVADSDLSNGVIGEMMSDRRLQQVIECSLCGFETSPLSATRSLDDDNVNAISIEGITDADGSPIEATDTAAETTMQHIGRDTFPLSDSMRIMFGLTSLSFNKYSNDTDICNLLINCATKAKDDFVWRFENPTDVNLNQYYSQLSYDIADFITVFAAAKVHFNLREKRAIKACFGLLVEPLRKVSFNSTNSFENSSEVLSESLLDYLSPETIITLVRSMSVSIPDVEEDTKYDCLMRKMNRIVDQNVQILNSTLAKKHDTDNEEIECVDAAELLNFARETQHNNEDDDDYDHDSLEVNTSLQVDLSSIEILKGEDNPVPGSSEVKLSNDFMIQDFNEQSESRSTENIMVSTKPISFLLQRKKYKKAVESSSHSRMMNGNNMGQVEVKNMMNWESDTGLSFDALCSILILLRTKNTPMIEKVIFLIKERGLRFITSASDYDLVNLICACSAHMDHMKGSSDLLHTAMEEILIRDVHETLDIDDLLRFIESLSDMRNISDFLIQIQNKSKLHLIFDRILQDMPESLPSVDKVVKFVYSYAKWRFWGSRGRRKIGWDRFETLGYLIQHCYHCIDRDEGCGDEFQRINSSILLSYTVALLGVTGSDIVYQTITLAQNSPKEILSQDLDDIIGLLFAQAKYIHAIKSEENKEMVDQIIKVACQSEDLKNLHPSYYALFIWSIGVLRDTTSEAFDFQRSHNIPVYTRDELRCLTPTMSALLVSIYHLFAC